MLSDNDPPNLNLGQDTRANRTQHTSSSDTGPHAAKDTYLRMGERTLNTNRLPWLAAHDTHDTHSDSTLLPGGACVWSLQVRSKCTTQTV